MSLLESYLCLLPLSRSLCGHLTLTASPPAVWATCTRGGGATAKVRWEWTSLVMWFHGPMTSGYYVTPPPPSHLWMCVGVGVCLRAALWVCSCTYIFVRTIVSIEPTEWGHFWRMRTFWLVLFFSKAVWGLRLGFRVRRSVWMVKVRVRGNGMD